MLISKPNSKLLLKVFKKKSIKKLAYSLSQAVLMSLTKTVLVK